MGPAPLFIGGTGSFAAEVAGWATESGLSPSGLIELLDPGRVGSTVHGLPVIALDSIPRDAVAAIGIGGDRRAVWERLAEAGCGACEIVHPRANVSATARLSPGVTIGPFAAIGAESEIGPQAILSRGVLVGHHVRIGAFATLNPGCNVGGNASVESDAFIGMGSVVVNGTTVGARAVLAAGAVAVRDVEADSRAQGVPARRYEP